MRRRSRTASSTGNDVGLKSDGSGALTSSYDDLFGNTTAYAGLTAGTGDLAAAVAFVDLAGHNFLLPGAQPSTDQGDPADNVGAEPTPNGARINLGAFGGTADAELSAPSAVVGDPATPTPTPSTPTPAGPAQPETHEEGGGAGCSVGGRRSASELSSMIFLLAVVLSAMTLRRRPASRR